MDVMITFRTPSSRRARALTRLHELEVTGVPATEAERMVEDFTRYRTAVPEAVRRMRYHFARDGADVMLALDFEHVIAITATEP